MWYSNSCVSFSLRKFSIAHAISDHNYHILNAIKNSLPRITDYIEEKKLDCIKAFSSTNNILVNLTSSLSNHIQHIRAYWSDICCISTIFSILWTHLCCHFIFSHSGAQNLIAEICLRHILLFLHCVQYHTRITSNIKFHNNIYCQLLFDITLKSRFL